MSLSNNMDDWTEEKCIRFMKEYRKRPILWNHNHCAFFGQKSKPAAWKEIAEAVDSSKYYYSQWFCFKYMAFLLDKKAEIKRQVRVEQGLEVDNSDDNDEVEINRILENYIESFDEEDNTGDSYDILEVPTTPSLEPKIRSNSVTDKERETRIIKIKRKSHNDTPPSPETKRKHHLDTDQGWEPTITKINRNSTPSLSSPSSDSDEEITHFAKYVAAKMRKYSEITKNAVQQAICELIFKADTDRENFQLNLMDEPQLEIDNNVSQPLDIKINYSDSE